jgi:glutamyl-tRNA reductase
LITGFETANEALKNISDFDVVISSLAVSNPVIKSFNYPDKLIVQKLLIDLSVPRSIDFEVENVPGILLYNIDQIEQKTSSIQENRKKAIPKVRAIMEEAIGDFSNWTQDMEVSPTIKKLKNARDDNRKAELKRYLNKVSEKEWKLLDKASKNIIQKVIKMPVLELKAACKRGDSEKLVEVLNELFDLEKSKVDSK